MSDAERLKQLHDTYVWEVNAAVGEDRMDLVWQLADDYVNEALKLITAEEAPGCGKPDCAVCRTQRPVRAAPARRRWLRRSRSRAVE